MSRRTGKFASTAGIEFVLLKISKNGNIFISMVCRQSRLSHIKSHFTKEHCGSRREQQKSAGSWLSFKSPYLESILVYIYMLHQKITVKTDIERQLRFSSDDLACTNISVIKQQSRYHSSFRLKVHDIKPKLK